MSGKDNLTFTWPSFDPSPDHYLTKIRSFQLKKKICLDVGRWWANPLQTLSQGPLLMFCFHNVREDTELDNRFVLWTWQKLSLLKLLSYTSLLGHTEVHWPEDHGGGLRYEKDILPDVSHSPLWEIHKRISGDWRRLVLTNSINVGIDSICRLSL